MARLYHENDDNWKHGSAHVVSKAHVQGLSPPEDKANVESSLEVRGKWKTLDSVLAVMIKEGIDREKIEQIDEGLDAHGR